MSLLKFNNKKKYFAAVTKDGIIVALGVTYNRRYESGLFYFAFADKAQWLKQGARYCELYVDHLVGIKIRETSIHTLRHSNFRHARLG